MNVLDCTFLKREETAFSTFNNSSHLISWYHRQDCSWWMVI